MMKFVLTGLTLLLALTLPGVAQSQRMQPEATPVAATTEESGTKVYLPFVISGTQLDTATQASTLLADGQFVDGPNVGSFDIQGYLAQQQSDFLPFASIISDKASYYSVNPRVVLTMLELLYPGSIAQGKDRIVASGLLPDRGIFSADLEILLLELTEHFYGQIYGRNLAAEDAETYQMPHTIRLRSGESIAFAPSRNSASNAIELTLASHLPLGRWKSLALAEEEDSFVAIYIHLFPESNPLDNSNQIRPPSTPPTDLVNASATTMPPLKMPFAAGDTWRFTGGPHAYDGCSNHAFSAVDFAPVGYSGCTDPIAEDRWITAPADATITRVSCGGCNVALSHGNGWGTRFYHVANPQVSVGDTIVTDQVIGNPSCAPVGISCGACSGSNTGVHQHIDLLYNGAFVAIEGTKFEEYTIRGDACYQGYLEKDGTKYYPPARITSRPDAVAPTATLLISGNAGQGEWYQLPLDLIISGTDDRTGIQSIQYQLQLSTSVTKSEWIEENGAKSILPITQDGRYTLTAKVSDMAGNWSTAETLVFQVDGTPPTHPIVTESSCGTVNGQWQRLCNQPSFEWTAAVDHGSGVAGYEVFWKSPLVSDSALIYTSTLRFTPEVVSQGEFTLKLRTVDQAGNWSNWQEAFVFGYDTVPPVGSILVEQGAEIAHSALVSVSVVVSDSGKIDAIRLRNGTEDWSEWHSLPLTRSWQLHGQNGESITVFAQLRDAAANLSEIVSDTITLNTRVAQAQSARYQLIRSTIGTATAQSNTSRFVLKGNTGQTSPIGTVQSRQFRLTSGYLRMEMPADLLPAPTRTLHPDIVEPETVCLLSIEYGALYTRKTQVEIQLDVTGAELMQVRPSEAMDRMPLDPYTTTVSINLPAQANQISTLMAYGIFYGEGGEPLCNGEVLSDTIVYDPLQPTLALKLVNLSAENDNREVDDQAPDFVRIAASDQVNGSGISEMQISAKADLSGAEWQPFDELIPLPLDEWDRLYVRVRDNAGNVSQTEEVVNQSIRRVYLPVVAR